MVFKADDFDKPEYEFFDPDGDKRTPWTPVYGDKTGQLSEIILSGSHESGWVTRLLKFEPNSDTTVNGTFTHDVWEEVFILEGEIHDIPLGQTFTKGMYACRPPGMKHGPWTSKRGAVTFETRFPPPDEVKTMTELDLRFRTALRRMAAADRIATVTRKVDTELEVAGLMKRHDGDRALLFESVIGSALPIVGNFLASPANVEAAFGTDRYGVREAMLRALTDPIAPQLVTDAPCQTFRIERDIDLGSLLPALRHAPGDIGRFITAGVVIVRDPETGVHNASYHRMQLLGGNRTAIKLDYGRHLRAADERAIARGVDLPIVVCIGTNLSLMYAGAFMGSQMPEESDELMAAGGIQGSPLAITRALTSDLPVPAECEIVLEARISPTETTAEGPFAEFVGYSSVDAAAPIMTVDAVTHRPDPIYYAISGAGRETVMLRKYVLEASALRAVKTAVPIVTDVNLTAGGLYRFHLVIQVAKRTAQHDGLQRNAMLAAFAALKDLDQVIVVDDDIDPHDPVEVEYAVATRVEASRDLVLIPGARGHEYVRVSDRGIRTKMGIDATVPFSERERFTRVPFADVALAAGDFHVGTDRHFE